MLKMEELRRDLQEEIQSLPEDLLEEVKFLIDFLRMREADDQDGYPITIGSALQQLESIEITHADEELAAYRPRYPLED
jgi:hypothetical protein